VLRRKRKTGACQDERGSEARKLGDYRLLLLRALIHTLQLIKGRERLLKGRGKYID